MCLYYSKELQLDIRNKLIAIMLVNPSKRLSKQAADSLPAGAEGLVADLQVFLPYFSVTLMIRFPWFSMLPLQYDQS